MSRTDALDAAVLLGEQQLQSLREGDIDRFIGGIDDFARACDEVARLAAETDLLAARERLSRLVASIDAAQLELSSLLREAASRMQSLRRKERAADSYLATPTWASLRIDRA